MNTVYKLTTLQSTYIASSSPYSSFAGSKTIKAGNDISRTPTREYMTLLQFDVSQILSSNRIISAYLVLQAQSISGLNKTELLFSKLNEQFDESVATWNNYSSINRTVISNFIMNELTLVANVTALVKSWVEMPLMNYGIAINALNINSDMITVMYGGVLENGNAAPTIIVEYSDTDDDEMDMGGDVFVEKTQSDSLCTFGIHNHRARFYSADEDYKNIISVVQSEDEEFVGDKSISQRIMMNDKGIFVPASQSASITTNSLDGAKALAVVGNKAPKLVSFIYKTTGGSYNLNDNIFVKNTLDTLMAPINKPQMYAALNYNFIAPTGSNTTVDKNGVVKVPVNSSGGKVMVGYNVKGVDTQSIEFENDIQVYTIKPANLDTEFEEEGTAIFTNLVENTGMEVSGLGVLTVRTKYLNFYADTSEEYKADLMFIVSKPLTNVKVKVERSINGGIDYSTLVENAYMVNVGQQFFLNEIIKGTTIPALVNLADLDEVYKITFTNTIDEPINASITSFNVAGKVKDLASPQVIDEDNMKYLNQNPIVKLYL